MRDEDRHVPVKVCKRPRYASGGLARAAHKVAGAGRGGDEMVVHVNRREFDEMRQRWGDPTINPDTGLPEFFLGDLFDGVKDYIGPVAGVAAGALIPGLGAALGSALPGLATTLGPTGTQALASGLLGAAAGGITNGGRGALLGALGGGAGALAGDAVGGGPVSSALGAAISPESTAPSQASGGNMPMALVAGGLSLLNGMMQGGDDAAAQGASDMKKAQAQNDKPLPTYKNKRSQVQFVMPDYTQRGTRGRMAFRNNSLAALKPVRKADGGAISGEEYAYKTYADKDQERHPDARSWGERILGWRPYMNGGTPYPTSAPGKGDRVRKAGGGALAAAHAPVSGRADNIEALLSDGEYVIDAETVALLGDGSTQAGADKLDQFRMNIRKHKGGALAQGKISPDAAPPEAYLGSR